MEHSVDSLSLGITHSLSLSVSLELQRSPYVYFLNCGTLRNRFILRLNESRDLVERARESVELMQRYVV